MTCVVYGLFSSRNPDELRYIGQTTRSAKRRLSQHLTYAKKRQTAVQLWIFREINDGFKIELRLLIENAKFNKSEIELIASHKGNARLLNHTEGGGGVLGHSPSVETRQKRAISVKKYWDTQIDRIRWHPTKEQKAKISAANKGNKSRLGQKHSEETKKKMRDWAAKNRDFLKRRFIGVKRSDETKRKISEAKKMYWVNRKAREQASAQSLI